MGIVGVNSTAGRAVKCIDPSKTTKSESSWLGYTLCDCTLRHAYHIFAYMHYLIYVYTYHHYTHTPLVRTCIYIYILRMLFFTRYTYTPTLRV